MLSIVDYEKVVDKAKELEKLAANLPKDVQEIVSFFYILGVFSSLGDDDAFNS